MPKSNEITVSSPAVARGIDRLLTVQRPVVLAHIRSIRRGHPNDSPEAIIRILERRYLAAVTTGGALVGASAAVPAIGTGASLALSGAETAGFLEASALFAQSVTEIHGIVVDEPDRARALVMTMVLGTAGSDLVKQLAGQASGTGTGKSAFWGEMITKNLPRSVMGPIADRIKVTFVKRFAVAQSGNVIGRLIPFGIGAAVGAGGNHLLGRQIVRSSREAFGPPPAIFPGWLEPVIKLPKQPKAPRAPKTPRPEGQRREIRVPLPNIRLPRRRRAVIAPDDANPLAPGVDPLAIDPIAPPR
ncbi:MAG: hypothetical protein ACOH10_04510 [Rhodoglobus sp.]|uniref:hypothetical protein n=1 Tax=Salinibacterium sp. G-O1 TaxID=3046208 RepID=UPI0024BB23CD|nr:hypothetical protein [Salinibacterium sp. G-O1]MDJ0334535.1 hypothetical protein [Salinibacterium sp. G-O1]